MITWQGPCHVKKFFQKSYMGWYFPLYNLLTFENLNLFGPGSDFRGGPRTAYHFPAEILFFLCFL